MSVYTNLDSKDVRSLLNKYNIGIMKTYKGIADGITNTNYFVNTTKGKYVITLFEDISQTKVKKYLKLMNYFSNKDLCSPEIMLTKDMDILTIIKSKPCSIMQKLNGKTITKTNSKLCGSIGKVIGTFHCVSKDYNQKITNDRDTKWVERSIERIKNHVSKEQMSLILYSSRVFKKLFAMNLPHGMIHSDLFRDNVLASKDDITGIIDYYYSFNGPFIYELAVIINDWCVNQDGSINKTKYNSFIKSYNSVRKISSSEAKQLNNAMIASGLRYYLSRLVDMIFPKVGEITHIKDPSVFEKIILKRINNQ